MAWTGDRAKRLPPDWWRLRGHVKKRAEGRCEWVENGFRCPLEGTDCDHIQAGDNHDPSNLQWLCKDHHKLKTQRESIEARWKIREQRPAERHPRWN